MKRAALMALVLGGLLLAGRPSAACPFCTMQGKTLLQESSEASMVLFGTLTNPNETNNTTDVKVETVVKDHAARGGKDTVRVDRFVPPSPDGTPYKYLLFCDVTKTRIDPYRGIACKPNSKVAVYLQKALEVKDKPVGERLRFFFDYLDSADVDVSNDAYKEFGNADYPDYRDMAKSLPADRLIKWLRDPETPGFRYGLYASMLGHCGKKKDAEVLKEMLDNADKRLTSGIDGILAGYVMLDTEAGWKYTQSVLKDPKKEFMFRYAALRSVRFLHEYRADVVGKKELLDGVCELLHQEDIADLAIEDLRKWKAWDRADRVLAVCKGDAYKQSIVRRSVLRYCLQCKGNAAAEAYVAAQRKADPEAVKDAEELLKYADEPVTPTTPTPK